jgi:protein transport protein SEC61 subunit gamma and related proteins
MLNLLETLKRYVRVLQVARKPSKDEFLASAKISLLGLFVIGIIGFLIYALFVLLHL